MKPNFVSFYSTKKHILLTKIQFDTIDHIYYTEQKGSTGVHKINVFHSHKQSISLIHSNILDPP